DFGPPRCMGLLLGHTRPFRKHAPAFIATASPRSTLFQGRFSSMRALISLKSFRIRCHTVCMSQREIDVVRTLLTSKPRPTNWGERRQRIDEIGSTWPVADDVQLESVDVGGVPGEWSIVPGSDDARVLMFFHGGGYCSGSIVSHRRMVTEAGRAACMRTLAVAYRLPPPPPHPPPPQGAQYPPRLLAEARSAVRTQ